MRYLLDTDTLSYLSDRTSVFSTQVQSRLNQLSETDQVFASTLSFYELQNGLFSALKPKSQHQFEMFIQHIKETIFHVTLPLEGDRIFGEIKHQYKAETGITKAAAKRHDIDFMLASTAITEGMVLVSNDKIFETIQRFRHDFKLENWAG